MNGCDTKMKYTEIQQYAKQCFNMNETRLLNAIINYYAHGKLNIVGARAVALAVGLTDN